MSTLRISAPGLGLIPLIILIGCTDIAPPLICPKDPDPGIVVNLVDSADGSPVLAPSEVVARDGAHADTVRGPPEPFVPGWASLAIKRPGPRDVTATAEGYRPWEGTRCMSLPTRPSPGTRSLHAPRRLPVRDRGRRRRSSRSEYSVSRGPRPVDCSRLMGARAAQSPLRPHVHSMRSPTDTDPVALRVLNELYANMSPAEKLSRVRDLTLTSVRLALGGPRGRHPGDSEQALLLRLARTRLGPATVERVFAGACDGDGS